MKKTMLIALVIALALSLTACDSGGGTDPGGDNPQTVTYTCTSGGTIYTLKITENTARYAAQNGDAYELTIGAKRSTGTVSTVASGVLTLKPSNSQVTFTATIAGNSLTELTGTITWTNNATETAPGVLNGGGSTETPAIGSTLAEKLQWVKDNAQSNTAYSLEVSANESIAPQTLSYTGKSGITIILKGAAGAAKVVSLSSNGNLFTVESGVTLVLDNNITLQGRNSNNASLVTVNSGGTLEMKAGAKITGNTKLKNGSDPGIGSGVFVDGGTFTMNGGEISGNTVFGNTASSNGGGVGVYEGGIFTMQGGEIFGNKATASTGRWTGGGGVFVENAGTFRIVTGTVYGSGEGAKSNTAQDGAAFNNRGETGNGTAQRGTFSGTTWNSKGNLTPTDSTIKVINGELQ
jgi:hypothetical protein